MGIIGLTDKPIFRRDGKIRAGRKNGNNLENLDHFLLHDAPALEPVLGKTPTEILFTIHSDDPNDFLKAEILLTAKYFGIMSLNAIIAFIFASSLSKSHK